MHWTSLPCILVPAMVRAILVGMKVVIADSSNNNNKALAGGEVNNMTNPPNPAFTIYVPSSSARKVEENLETIKGNIGQPDQISDDCDQNRWNKSAPVDLIC